MKESSTYINKNVESGQKFPNNTKDYRLQYINHLQKFNIFVEVNTYILRNF